MSLTERFVAIVLIALTSGMFAYFAAAVAVHWLPLRARYSGGQVFGVKATRLVDLFFLGLVFAFFVAFAVIDVRKYETLSIFGIDFAYFDQAIWNSLHGRLFEATAYLDSPTLLGHHFAPILLGLVPFYALGVNAPILAILPALSISFSALPIYWFAKQNVGRFLAWAIAFAFLLAPGVLYLALGQFYELTLIVPLLSLAMLFLLRRRYVPFLICLGLGLLCKEEVPIIAIGFGVYISVIQRKFLQGLALSVLSLLCALVLLLVVIPHFQGSTNYYYFGGSADRQGLNLYSYMGRGLSDILVTLLTHPDVVLQQVIIAPKVEAVLSLFLPLGPIPIVGAEITALALPTLGYVLLSDAPIVSGFGSLHYGPVFPFLFFGAVVGARRVIEWIERYSSNQIFPLPVQKRMAAQVALGTFIIGASLSNLYLRPEDQPARDFGLLFQYELSEHRAVGESLAKGIPGDSTVLTQTDLAPYVSERKRLYIDTAIPCLGMADYVFVDTIRPWYNYRKDAWTQAFAKGYFEMIAQQDGYVLAKRKPMENTLNVQYENGLMLLGYSVPATSTMQGGQTLRLIVAWRSNQEISQRLGVLVQVLDEQGHLWAQNDHEFCGGSFPTNQWNKGDLVTDDSALHIPPTIPTGSYHVVLAVRDEKGNDPVAMRDSTGKLIGDELQLAFLRIQKNKESFTASDLHIEQPLFVDMQEMRFLGYVPPRQTISAGELLQVGLYWRAREKPRGDYIVAVQLRDAGSNVAFEQASRPANDTYPTTQWDAGEVLLDWHDFKLPNDIAPGEYQVFVVLRDSAHNRVLGQTAISSLTINR